MPRWSMSSSDGESVPELTDGEDEDAGWNSGVNATLASTLRATSASASSCGPAEVVPPDTSNVPEYTLVTHEGKVFLDTPVHGPMKLVHRETLEGVALPEGKWQLVFLNGFGALQKPDSIDVLLVEDVLQRRLCQNTVDGSFWVKDRGTKEVYSLTTKKRMYKPGTARYCLFDLHETSASVDYYQVFWPRGSSAAKSSRSTSSLM